MRLKVLALGVCLLASSLFAQTPARHLADAQWREDMQAMRQAMVANHKNLYHSVTPQQLGQAFTALDRDLPAPGNRSTNSNTRRHAESIGVI
jgi:hypothetical protein